MTPADRPPFDVIPFSGGLWKVLDWKRGRYIRGYHSLSAARRYASTRNRKAGFRAAAPIRNRPLCDCCGSTICERRSTRRRRRQVAA